MQDAESFSGKSSIAVYHKSKTGLMFFVRIIQMSCFCSQNGNFHKTALKSFGSAAFKKFVEFIPDFCFSRPRKASIYNEKRTEACSPFRFFRSVLFLYYFVFSAVGSEITAFVSPRIYKPCIFVFVKVEGTVILVILGIVFVIPAIFTVHFISSVFCCKNYNSYLRNNQFNLKRQSAKVQICG